MFPNAVGASQRALLQLLAGAAIISFSGVWVKWAAAPPLTSAFYRVFFGAAVLFVFALVTKELRLPPPRSLALISLCGFAFALDLICWHSSILYIGPGLATILGNFQVFLLAACGFFFYGEQLRPRFLLALPLAFAGLFLVVGGNWQTLSDSYRTGIIYGLLTALCYAAYLLSLRRIQSDPDSTAQFQSMMLVSLSCTLCLAAMILVSGGTFSVPSRSSLLSLFALGLFSQALGWVLIARAIPHVRPSLTGLVLLLQPSLAFIWDVLIFSRPTSHLNWLGAIVTITAIYLGLTGKSSLVQRQKLPSQGKSL